MKCINVYEQYFEAEGSFNGRTRHAAKVMLIAVSEEGNIKYDAAVSFFPHDDPDDFAVSYDAYFEKNLYSAKGRRSKKRESEIMEVFKDLIGELAASVSAKVFFDRPLREASFG